MALALQAVVALNKDQYSSGMSSIGKLTSNVTQSMMMAFGGVAGEIVAMGRAFGGVGVAIGVMKQSITVGASFEQQMANVASVSGLVGDELDQVAVAARNMAKETKFTATQASEALYSLASAGISGADALVDTLQPALLLAGATLSDTKLATETMTAALAAFKIPASEAMRVADQFAGAIARSPATMERLSDAMKRAGPAAAAFGISLEKTVAEIAAFHVAGLRGQMAGTSFRQVLIQLAKQAENSSTVIGGALKGWSAGAEGVTGAVKRLNDAGVNTALVATELGSRAGPALALMMKVGSVAMGELAAKIKESANVAKMYEIQMATLTGKFFIFKSAVEEVWLKIFTKLAPALTKLTLEMTKAVNWVSKLSAALFSGKWSEAGAMFSDLGKAIVAAFKSAFESVREYAGKMADAFKNLNWGASFSTLTSSAVSAFDTILSEARSAFGKIISFLKGQDWGAVWNTAKQGAIAAFNFWYGTAADVWGKIASFLKGINGADLLGSVRAGAGKVWSEIESMAKSIWPAIRKYAENAWAAIIEAGRIALEAIANAAGRVDWAGAFSIVKTALAGALQTAYQIAAGWVTDIAMLIREIDWGELGRMAFEAIKEARDFIVKGFESLVSSGKIADVFKRIGQVIGALLKAAFEGIGGWFSAAWDDLASGNWAEKAKSFYKSVFVGGLQSITGLFIGILEGLFGKNVIDNVVVGATLMMLDIKKAIQSKIGDILNAFNLLMAGIITKTSEGAARVAEVFGFEGMAEKIRGKSAEFSAAFSAGTNGMKEAAEKTGEEIRLLEDYISNLNAPTKEAEKSMVDLGGAMDAENKAANEVSLTTEKLTSEMSALAPAVDVTAAAFSKLASAAAAIGPIIGEFIDDIDKADMADNLAAMGKAFSDTAPEVKKLGDATKDAKVSTSDLLGMLTAFKTSRVTAFDVSDFVNSMKRLAVGLAGVVIPEIKLPDFSLMKIPRINAMEISSFVSAIKRLATGLKGVIFPDLTPLTDLGFIAIPELSSGRIRDLLDNLGVLKNGLMKLDFGALGNIDIKIKGGGGAAGDIKEILGLLKGAKGVVWA